QTERFFACSTCTFGFGEHIKYLVFNVIWNAYPGIAHRHNNFIRACMCFNQNVSSSWTEFDRVTDEITNHPADFLTINKDMLILWKQISINKLFFFLCLKLQ